MDVLVDLSRVAQASLHQREGLSYILWRRAQNPDVKRTAFQHDAAEAIACIVRSLEPSHDAKVLHNAARVVAELCVDPSPASVVEYRKEGCRDSVLPASSALALLADDVSLRANATGEVDCRHYAENAALLFAGPRSAPAPTVWGALVMLISQATATLVRSPAGRTVSYTSRLWQQLAGLCAEAALAILRAVTRDAALCAANREALESMRIAANGALDVCLARPDVCECGVPLRLAQLSEETAAALGVAGVLPTVVARALECVASPYASDAALSIAALLLRLLRRRRLQPMAADLFEVLVGSEMEGRLPLVLEAAQCWATRDDPTLPVSRLRQLLTVDAEAVLCRILLDHSHVPALVAGLRRYTTALEGGKGASVHAAGMFRCCLNTLAKYILFRGNDGPRSAKNVSACLRLLTSVADINAWKGAEPRDGSLLSAPFWDASHVRSAHSSPSRECLKVLVAFFGQPHNAARFRELFELALGVPIANDDDECAVVASPMGSPSLSAGRPLSARRKLLPPIQSSSAGRADASPALEVTRNANLTLGTAVDDVAQRTCAPTPSACLAAALVASVARVLEGALSSGADSGAPFTSSLCCAWAAKGPLASADADTLTRAADILSEHAMRVEADLRAVARALERPAATNVGHAEIKSVVACALSSVGRSRSLRALLSRSSLSLAPSVPSSSVTPTPPQGPRPPRRPASRAGLGSASRNRTLTGPAALLSMDVEAAGGIPLARLRRLTPVGLPSRPVTSLGMASAGPRRQTALV